MSDVKNGSQAIEAVNKVPNERLQDLFEEAVRERMKEPDAKLDIQEFDVEVRKEVDQSAVFVDVHVFGMATQTSKDQFATTDPSGNVKVVQGGGSFTVKLDDDSVVKFVFVEVVNLNATDYRVTYRLA